MHAAERPEGTSVIDALRALSGVKVSGRRFSVMPVQARTAAEVDAATRGGSVYALYVAAGVPDALIPELRGLAQRRGWLIFAQDPRHVPLGATVGVEQDERRRNILLNAAAALEQGRKFEAGFLGLCKVIR